MDSGNHKTIEARMKNLVFTASLLLFLTVLLVLAALWFFAELSTPHLGMGAAIAAVTALLWFFVLSSQAAAAASDAVKDASNLAKAASAMAVGNFGTSLRGGTEDEFGQIEVALAQLALVQKGLIKDIETMTKSHEQGNTDAVIDERPYAGDYKTLVSGINNALSGYAASLFAIAEVAKAFSAGELKARLLPLSGKKAEVNKSLEALRQSLEAMSRELNAAQAAAKASKDETENVKREVALAREDAAYARREASDAKQEAAAAARELTAAKRETERAKEEAKRATDRLKTAAAPAIAKPIMQTAIAAKSAATAPKPMSVEPIIPAAAPKPAVSSTAAPVYTRTKIRDNAPPPAIKSVKIKAPSGAHEYDRKDMGKF